MSQRLLIVEDNPANSELLADWLDAEGFQTVMAENLEQAFGAIKTHQFAAILLDVQLGSEDGLELAVAIRKDADLHDMPIIAVTAHAMITDQERVAQAGCNACVSKPIDFGLLKATLDRWLTVATHLPPKV